MVQIHLEHEDDKRNLGNQPKSELSLREHQKIMNTPDIEQRLEAVAKSSSQLSVDPKYHFALVGSVQSKVDEIKEGKRPLFTLDEMKVLDAALSGKSVDSSQEQQRSPINELSLPQRGKEETYYTKVASPNSRGSDSSQNLAANYPDVSSDEFASRGKNSSPVTEALRKTAEQRREERELALAA